MKQYLVTQSQGGFYWYVKYDCTATALLGPGCVFTIGEAKRVFEEALKDSIAEKVTLYEIDDDGNKRIVKRLIKERNKMRSSKN